MIKISPLLAFKDNYIWVVESSNYNNAFIVDPGESRVVLDYIDENNLNLTDILITHHHYDHTNGIDNIIKKYPNINIYGSVKSKINTINCKVVEGDKVILLNGEVLLNVFNIPGHTLDHIAFYNQEILFCGDTLFASGCGRVFEGTHQQMLNSLLKLKSLPEMTKVYCAHEYTLANLEFAKIVEPNNKDIITRLDFINSLRRKNTPSLPSTIKDELDTNPFFRIDKSEVIKSALEYGAKNDAAEEIFAAIRTMKDKF